MPFIKSNVHTHTTFCDGQDSMEDMVKAAVSLGFDTLGFSFHSYTPFDPSYCIRDYYEYMREFERLRKEYGQTICLLNGVELDLYGERPSVCDFVIGSVHYLEENGRRYPVDFSARGFKKLVDGMFRGDALAAAERYYAEVRELAGKVKPDVYGHFDLITRFNQGGAFFDEESARYKSARALCRGKSARGSCHRGKPRQAVQGRRGNVSLRPAYARNAFGGVPLYALVRRSLRGGAGFRLRRSVRRPQKAGRKVVGAV